MKKIFTLFFALFMMVFCAKAQYLLQEGFEGSTLPTGWTIIDNDNDGSNWELTGTAEQFSTHTGNGVIVSASYDNDAGTALTPDNWLITPAINITSNADLTFWVKGQDPSYASEYYSVYVATANTIAAFTATTPVASGITTGDWAQQTVNLNSYVGQNIYIAFRHHNCTDMFFLNLDDVEIFAQPSDPTISATPATIDFGTVGMPGNKIESTIISAYNLTADITATTAAPFEVSADGTTYGTTATINQNGGTLYVKYTPATVGIANGTVTLSSTGATNFTVTLTGTALDCSNNPLPYTNDFTDETLNNCWTIVDANNDGDPSSNQGMWSFMTTDGYAQYFYHSTNPADDWLISPVFYIPENGATASFDYKVRSSTYPEKFSVYIIPANGSYLNAIQVVDTRTVTNTTFETQYLDLNNYNYAGQSIQIAIKAESDADKWGLNISNFFIGTNIPTTVIVNRTSIDFGTIPAGTSLDAMVIISSTNLNDAINITTSAPYEVSLDGTTYSASVTIPANSALAVEDTVYVQFAPTTAGTFSNIVTISTTSTNDTIALTGVSVECNTITTFPFIEDFEETSTTRSCWTINDANNDGHTFSFSNGKASYRYDSNNDADDWLISPEFTLTGSQIATFDYWCELSSYPERFQVFAIATGGTPEALTSAIDVTNTTAESQIVDLSSLTGNYRIAIKCISDADQFYFDVDNFAVNSIAEASLTVDPDSVSFAGAAMNVPTDAEEIEITGLALTSSINVTAPANFEVSTDDLTYGATATIANTGVATQATLYVRMNATTAGIHSGNITLTSGTATANIYVEGNAVDCSTGITTLPFTHDFNDAVVPPTCWGYNDETNFGVLTVDEEAGDYAAIIGRVDYLSTPEIHSTAALNVSVDYLTYAGMYQLESSSTFRIGYSTTNDTYGSFTWLAPVYAVEATGDFTNYSTLVPAGTKYVAIDVTEIGTFYGSYYNYLFFDNFTLTEVSEATISTSVSNINFGNLNVGDADVQIVSVAGANLTADITATTTAPYEVSTNNITYSTTATIPAAGGDLYVRYTPTTAGTFNGMINLTSGTAAATVTLVGTATVPLDCNVPASLPFIEGFEGEDIPECWTSIDADGDGHEWYVLNNSQSSSGGFNVHSGEGHITSASYASGALTPDNWLITPQIAMGTNGHLSFWAAGQDASWASEVFSVYLSTTGPATTDFTVTLLDHQTTTGTMTEYTADLSAYAGQNIYIAFRHHDVTDMFRLNLDDVSITGETSIADVESNNVSVYPNPANNVINVNANSNISNVEVFTIAGQKVGDFTANSTNTAISTANLTNGLYMMKIHTENGVINKKFSVVR